MTGARRAGWLVALAATMLAGCGPAQPPLAEEPRDPTLASDSPVALAPYSAAGDGAVVVGTLALHRGCLYLDLPSGRVLPVFPWPGTRWNPADQSVTIFGRARFRVGERLTAGGGGTFTRADEGAAAVQQQLVIPRPHCDARHATFLYFGAR